MRIVLTPRKPTQRPPHSADSPPRLGMTVPWLPLVTTAPAGSESTSQPLEAIPPSSSRRTRPTRRQAARAHRGRGVLVNVVLVDGEDLAGAVGFIQVEVAVGFELHRPVFVLVRVESVDLEVGVLEDVFLALAGRGRRCGGERGLGCRLGGGLGQGLAGRLRAAVVDRGELISAEEAEARFRPSMPPRLMPESLGRPRLIPESAGAPAVTSESPGLLTG